jgi:hypothetical protein
MSTSNYVIAWLIYIVACGGLILALHLAVKNFKRRELGQLQVVLAAAFLLVPVRVSNEHALLAPAWLMTIMEAIAGGDLSAWRAGTALVMALLGAAVLALGLEFFRRQRASNRAGTVANKPENAINTVDEGLAPTEVSKMGDN